MSNNKYINTLIKIVKLPQANTIPHVFNGDCAVAQPTKPFVIKRPCDGIVCDECIFTRQINSSELALRVLNNGQ